MTDTILQQLQPVRWRQRTAYVLRAFAWGLSGGSGAAVLLAVLRLLGWEGLSWSGWASLLGVPAAAAVVSIWWSWRRSDWLPAARAVDVHYELKDRTETALAFLRRPPEAANNAIEALQLADAMQHLQQVEAAQVVPAVLPKSFRWSLASTVLAVVLLCWPTGDTPVNAGPTQPLQVVVTEAEIVAEDLQQLLEQLPEEHDPEVEALVKELLAQAEEMKQPGVDVREALAKLSEMQSALQALAAELNVAATDEQLKAIGEALQSAESLSDAGKALQEGQYDKAAEALSKLDAPKLDRKESRAVADKLNKAADAADQKGLKKLGDAAKQTAEGLDKDKSDQAKSGLGKLAEAAKQHGNSKKISEMLKKQSGKLADSKANVQGNGENSGNKLGNRASRNAGRGTNETVQGTRTELDAKRQEQKIQGQKGDQGDADIEKISSTEADDQAKRELKEVYQTYRKLSDAVLESEDIPLGHRQTIRRYFEAIRPTRDDAEPTGPGDSPRK
jgi:hypothetical protein